MFEIHGFDITLSRGDTASINIVGTGDIPGEGDKVVASLKKSQVQTSEIWRKELDPIDDGVYLFRIESADTADLDFGQYWWDVRVFYANGEILTPIPPSSFKVERVITNLPESGGG